jgi:hypothetical protein
LCVGILPLLQSDGGDLEDGIAAVLGHEIGHAIARLFMY